MPTYNPITLNRTQDAIMSLSPKLWVSAANSYRGITASGTVASSLQDNSGNGCHFAAMINSRRPTIVPNGKNSRPVLRFNGSGNYMTNVAPPDAFKWAHTGASTWFVVHKPWTVANPNAVGTVLDNVSNAGSIGSRSGIYFLADDRTASSFNDALRVVVTNSSPNIVSTTAQNDTAPSNVWVINVIQMDPGNATAANRLYVAKNNGAWTQGNASTASVGSASCTYALTLGANAGDGINPYTGDLAEIVGYNSLLSAGNITSVLNALNSGWGIY